MFTYEPMTSEDIFAMDIANLDGKSENFTFDYYLCYLEIHPADFITVRRFSGSNPGTRHCRTSTDENDLGAGILPNKRIQPDARAHPTLLGTAPVVGYIFGKLELKGMLCMHLSALSVGPAYRSLGFGTALLRLFEANGDSHGASFSDLYVREHNAVAVSFYIKNGYSIYRMVIDYYGSPVENACDMRKPLAKDTLRESIIRGRDIHSSELM